jgi:type II secretory pathway predicted ATPase ExeA
MQDKKFLQLLNRYPTVIREYCDELGWDYDKFKTSISDEGISHPDLYLEDPNEGIIEKFSQFLDPTNQSYVFIISDDVGMGKSSIRDFISKSLDELKNYHTVLITDPRMSSLQILRLIAQQIGCYITTWDDREMLRETLRKKLIEIGSRGLNLILWVDEAEKINKETISELRALSEIKTESGTKACKVILSGTPGLIKKIESYIKTEPEDAIAFGNQANMNTVRLARWKPGDIFNYWKLLSDYCGKRNPFTTEAADSVYKVSEGKPRTVAQLTKMSINTRAMHRNGGLEITSEDVLLALRGQLEE